MNDGAEEEKTESFKVKVRLLNRQHFFGPYTRTDSQEHYHAVRLRNQFESQEKLIDREDQRLLSELTDSSDFNPIRTGLFEPAVFFAGTGAPA